MHPYVLLAISPSYAIELCIALQGAGLHRARRGRAVRHRRRGAVRRHGPFRRALRSAAAGLFFVLPCLVLNYFGQGALVVADPGGAAQPVLPAGAALDSACRWWCWPPLATIIASQAVISGAYSMTRQCMQLGFLPRMTVRHTSATEEGQIYVPQVNLALLVGVLLLVLAFKTSDNLASAYGIAVTGTFLCTCVLAADRVPPAVPLVARWPRSACSAPSSWSIWCSSPPTPLKVAGGRLGAAGVRPRADGADDVVEARARPAAGALGAGQPAAWRRSWRGCRSRARFGCPGMAIFLTGNPDYVPDLAAAQPQAQQGAARDVCCSSRCRTSTCRKSRTRSGDVAELAPGIHRVILRYGFMESPNIPRALEDLPARGVPFDPMQASYFLGREVLVPARRRRCRSGGAGCSW